MKRMAKENKKTQWSFSAFSRAGFSEFSSNFSKLLTWWLENENYFCHEFIFLANEILLSYLLFRIQNICLFTWLLFGNYDTLVHHYFSLRSFRLCPTFLFVYSSCSYHPTIPTQFSTCPFVPHTFFSLQSLQRWRSTFFCIFDFFPLFLSTPAPATSFPGALPGREMAAPLWSFTLGTS